MVLAPETPEKNPNSYSKETLNSLEPTESDYFKMNFVGSFSIDRDSIQLPLCQI